MRAFIDSFLNRTTMYRLVVCVLLGLVVVAMALGALKLLPYSPLMLAFSLLLITALCVVGNVIFARIFRVPANGESLYISAFILVLIITPPRSLFDGQFLEIAVWASLIAMTSKFIFAIGKKHVFNPVAFGVAVTSVTLNQSASWWVATQWMMPFVLIGGILIVWKIRRFPLVIAFFIAALVSIFGAKLATPLLLPAMFWKVLMTTPLLFFAFVMLTEPLTTPPTQELQMAYGALAGFLFAPWIHVGSFYFTPEIALLVANVFSYVVSPKQKLLLKLREKRLVASDVYDFRFVADKKLPFRAGQYLEWTLGLAHPDSRGNRRYFTVSSSPTERTVDIGVKFDPKSSAFKKRLLAMRPGDTVVASQLAGDFTMPRDTAKKLVFVAGGIGVTPFRSMIKFLVDMDEKRDVVLLYSNRAKDCIAYADIFDEAEKKLGIRTVYTLTDQKAALQDWKGYTGYIDRPMIEKEIPDYLEREFYLSGPRSMIIAFEKTLYAMGVSRTQIRKDFFPGFA